MSRKTGVIPYSLNFEVLRDSPLDSRCLVDSYDDLIKSTTWANGKDSNYYVYKGMIVSCKDQPGKLYQLIGDDYTSTSNWVAIGGSDLSDYAKKSEIPTKTSDLTNDSNFAIYERIAEANAANTTQLIVDETDTNDTNVLTEDQTVDRINTLLTANIPTKVSQLTNDSGYITSKGGAATALKTIATVTGTNSAELVRGNMADNDQFRILVGGTASNAGYVEIATADDASEPIYVRQYSGVFTTLKRTATLLDDSGNTTFPGKVTAASFVGSLTGTATNADTVDGIHASGLFTALSNTDNGISLTIGGTTKILTPSYAATAGSVAWDNVTSKPTTISGYGITDITINNGTITIGSNSITPLTSHQSLANCAQTVTTSGVGVVTGVSKSDSTVTVTKTEPLIQMFDGIETGSITPTSFIVLEGFSTKAVIWSTQNNAFYVKATSSSDVSYYFTISNGTWNGYTLSAWFPQNSTPDRTEAITYVTKYTGSGAYPVRSFYIDYGGNLVEILPKISTSGSGNAITALSVTSSNSGTTINATKGSSFVNSAATSGTGNAVTGYSLSSGKLTLTKGTQFVPYSDVFTGSSGTTGMFGKIPKINTDGVMEIGQYLDFHHDNTTDTDFNVRFRTQNNTSKAWVKLPIDSGTLALTSQIEEQTNVKNIEFNNNAGIWASSTDQGSIIINNGCTIDLDGWIETPTLTLEDLRVSYQGTIYTFNAEKAIELGLLSS